jgi:hypothetical protein
VISALLRAFPDWLSAGLLFALWNEPERFGMDWFRSGVFTLLLEFFVIHAGGFMAVTVMDPAASPGTRSLRLAGWSAGYLLFVGLIAWSLAAWWMIFAFAWFCFSKLQAIWTSGAPTELDRLHAIVSWALSVAVYLGAVGLTVSVEVPMLGATAAVRDAAGITGSGVWEAEPHRALAGAVLYFAIMGLSRPFLAAGFAARKSAA